MRALTILALFGGANAISWTSKLTPRQQAHSSNVPNTLIGRAPADALAPAPAPQTNFTRGPKGDPANDPRFKPFSCGTGEANAASQDLIEVHKALFGEHNHDGGAPGAPGVGAPGMGDGQVQFQPGSIPQPAGGAGTPTNPEGKTTLW